MKYTANEAKALKTKVFSSMTEAGAVQVTAYLKENAAKKLGVDIERVNLLTHSFNSHQSPVDEIIETFDGYNEIGEPVFSYSIQLKELT